MIDDVKDELREKVERLQNRLNTLEFVLMESRNALHSMECYDSDFYRRTCPGLIDHIDATLGRPVHINKR
jgi:hypothetical protein